jgi:hypothetical protein
VGHLALFPYEGYEEVLPEVVGILLLESEDEPAAVLVVLVLPHRFHALLEQVEPRFVRQQGKARHVLVVLPELLNGLRGDKGHVLRSN